MRSGLWVTRDDVRLFVGSGTREEVLALVGQWSDAGWGTEVRSNVRARRKLRTPYVPLTCSLCSWAGLNLGVHHARAHSGVPAPSGKRTAPVVSTMAKTARAAQDRNRVPRSGLLVVEVVTTDDVYVYRVQRVSGNKVTLAPLSGTPGEARGSEPFTLGIAETLQRFRPVGRWVGR